MTAKLLSSGLVIWVAGTAILRVGGHRLLPDNPAAVVVLLGVSFGLIAGAGGWLLRFSRLPRAEWCRAAALIALPTMLLDPFSSAFFSSVFPNIPSTAAGLFGGWMLCCCGAVFVAALVRTE